jgi:transcriptional regulator with XRE-family HTH domain
MNKQAHPMQKLQAAKLTEIGARLVSLREQRDLTLEEVSSRTHIPLRNLRAIEAGDLGVLPEAVYVKSFIRQYANAVGVNGVQMASEFPTEPVVTNDRPLWQQFIKATHLRPAQPVHPRRPGKAEGQFARDAAICGADAEASACDHDREPQSAEAGEGGCGDDR